jgi:hypothetical protein
MINTLTPSDAALYSLSIIGSEIEFTLMKISAFLPFLTCLISLSIFFSNVFLRVTGEYAIFSSLSSGLE